MAGPACLIFGPVELFIGILAGCSPTNVQPHSPFVGEPTLTTEAARKALLTRMKADQFFGLDADRWGRERVEASHEGWHDFGPRIRINTIARRYTVQIGPPPEVKGCTTEFEGGFSLRGSHWMADDPVEVRPALSGGGSRDRGAGTACFRQVAMRRPNAFMALQLE